jgi:endonuclease/exonuclease/phosphatase family metal-dependent hydrolase
LYREMMVRAGFRLVTFNLLNDPESWPRRAQLVIEQLAALAPDVVALQEVGVPDTQTGPLVAALSAATELSYHTASCELRRPNGWVEKLAVLSSFPIEASDALDADGEGQVCLWSRLRLAQGRALDLYNVHLNPSRAAIRRRQLAAVLDWMASRDGQNARVLCGDFNTTSTGSILPAALAAGFASAHALAHGREPDRTFPTPLRPDIYALRPGACLDFIFIEPSVLSVRACRVVLDRPHAGDQALYPSDHTGVLADLAWQSSHTDPR